MAEQASTISNETTVNQAIEQVPSALAIFKRVGIDACCGGSLAIGEAARRHGLDAEQILTEIRSEGALT